MRYSVLVMETPDDCDHCLIGCPYWNDEARPFPQLCPLRSMPQKNGKEDWDACIDTLIGGKKL